LGGSCEAHLLRIVTATDAPTEAPWYVRSSRQDGGVSTIFAAKAVPAETKLRGGYYTPEPLARFITCWVARAGRKLLEPSCGDGAILTFLAPLGDALGVELFPDEAAKAAEVSGADVVVSDFFNWFSPNHHGAFDGVAGNPPYIRFGSWEEASREPAFE